MSNSSITVSEISAILLFQPSTSRLSVAQELGLILVVLLLGTILRIYGWHDASHRRFNTFLNADNFIDGVAAPMSYYAIMAVGLTIVIIAGGINTSVGLTMALSALGCAAASQGMPAEAPRIEALLVAIPGRFHSVNFEIKAGEIVGFQGLVGVGHSEIAKAIFGLDPHVGDTIGTDGKALPPGGIKAAMRARAGLVPEDCKRQGCILRMPCRATITLSMLDRLTRGGRLLIVDEPTRGDDVRAKAAIHALTDELAQQGLAVMLISSELSEVINLSTRVIVMREGHIAGELPRAGASQDAVLRLMAGVLPQSA